MQTVSCRFWTRVTVSICIIQSLGLGKERWTLMFKNIILYFYSSMVMLVWSRRAVGESSHTKRSCGESEQQAGTDFTPNSKPYIASKLLRDQHCLAFSLMNYLFSIGHGLRPCICGPVSWGCRTHRLHLWSGIRFLKRMTLNNLMVRFCNAWALEKVEYPFIATAPKPTLARIGRTW